MSTPETWDKIYGEFKEFNQIDLAFYERFYSIIDDSMKSEKLNSILEVGCGSGMMAGVFQKNYFSVGLDRSISPVKVAREKFGVKHLLLGDMFTIPFKDNSFDLVWNEGVLEHFKNPLNLSACKEMARVSKKFVIIAVPNRFTLYVIRKNILKIIKKWPYGYEESYTIPRLKNLMKNAGLKVVEVKGIRIIPPIKEKKKFSDLLALATFTMPLNTNSLNAMLNRSLKFEQKHNFLTKLFGYEIIAIGKK